MQYQQAQQAWIQQQQVQQEWINYQQQKQREADLAEQARKEQERLAHLNSLGALLALTPTQFEEIVCKLLATIKGLYSVKRVGGSGDLVADIIARNNHGELVVIQCKRYGGPKSQDSFWSKIR
jgi:restriction endonuclease Mrr